jgi:hypothetical protein
VVHIYIKVAIAYTGVVTDTITMQAARKYSNGHYLVDTTLAQPDDNRLCCRIRFLNIKYYYFLVAKNERFKYLLCETITILPDGRGNHDDSA